MHHSLQTQVIYTLTGRSPYNNGVKDNECTLLERTVDRCGVQDVVSRELQSILFRVEGRRRFLSLEVLMRGQK